MKTTSGFLWLLLGGLWLLGADPAPVRLLALDGPTTEVMPARLDRFSGGPLVIPALFLKNTAQPGEITCDVYVDGDALGALLAENVPFKPEAAAPAHPWLVEGAFTLPLPESGKMRLRVLLHALDDRRTKHLLGQCIVQVTPADELKTALQRLTQPTRRDTLTRPFLFGPLESLRELFNEWKIPFEEGGMDPPPQLPTGVLAVGEMKDATRLPSVTLKSSLLLLHADSSLDAGLTVKQTPQTCLTLLGPTRPGNWQRSPFLHRQLIAQIQRHLDLHE